MEHETHGNGERNEEWEQGMKTGNGEPKIENW